MKPLTPDQQKAWDAGFVRAIRLMAKGPRNRRFWDNHERRLAAKALKRKKPAGNKKEAAHGK